MGTDSGNPMAVVPMGSVALVAAPLRLERADTLANRLHEYITVEKAHWMRITTRNSMTDFNKLEKYFARRQFNRAELRQFFVELRQKESAVSYNRCLGLIRGFVRWLYRSEYIKEPLHEFLPNALPIVQKEVVIFTDEQYRKFVREHLWEPYGWAMVCAYHTAFRLKDVCDLMWSEVDLVNQVIRKIPSKTKRRGITVEVPIISGTDLYTWLKRMSEDKDDDVWVCPDLHRRYFAHSGLPHEFTRALRKSGIYGLTFHKLRATFESKLANSGINLGLAAKITGRTNPRSLMRYIKPDPRAVRQAVAHAMELSGKPVVCSSLPVSGDLSGSSLISHDAG